MDTTPHFQKGQTVVLRELWRDRIWEAGPEIVVRDTSDMLALYRPSTGVMIKQAVSADGSPAGIEQMLSLQWTLSDEKCFGLDRLRLTIPGEPYSVLLFWEPEERQFRSWYINLEEPLWRTELGFDFIDMILDIIAFPDLSHWQWKDEHEIRYAIEKGQMFPETVERLYQSGQEVINWLQSGFSPFTEWIDWEPDLSWTPPELPANWDVM